MKTRTFLIVITVAILMILFGAYSCSTRGMKKETRKVEVGFRGEARVNSLLAAGEYLQKRGMIVKKQSNFKAGEELWGNSLVICTFNSIPREKEALMALENFVSSGGTLIYGFSENSRDSTMVSEAQKEFLGIRSMDKLEFPVPAELSLNLENSETNVPIVFSCQTRYKIKMAHSTLNDVVEDGNTLYSDYSYGGGRIIFVNDLGLFENRRIDQDDNILLFDTLAYYEFSNAVIVYSRDMPSIYAWLWNNAFAAILCSFLLLLVWLMNRTKRFGPLQEINDNTRRNIIDHIEGASLFYDTHNRSVFLFKELRRIVYEGLKKKYLLSDTGAETKLATITGIDSEEIDRALNDVPNKNNIPEFIITIQKLRKYLS